ncbi:hypothetical protein BESB_016740 [Besnoitia besnoiti]|uniref:SAC3/GANP/THP3 conserved domain-containing protein n=1 Tax=Besnoitia besnoiti TaxID=94643 RepID=A0A2A9M8Y7_BESBE|nr:hypothetical protein BESB_016740 [Besnoitia besnoiti]PFH32356.1 hypothetical protein BESB_016740 [Besnoitia besnoiti]
MKPSPLAAAFASAATAGPSSSLFGGGGSLAASASSLPAASSASPFASSSSLFPAASASSSAPFSSFSCSVSSSSADSLFASSSSAPGPPPSAPPFPSAPASSQVSALGSAGSAAPAPRRPACVSLSPPRGSSPSKMVSLSAAPLGSRTASPSLAPSAAVAASASFALSAAAAFSASGSGSALPGRKKAPFVATGGRDRLYTPEGDSVPPPLPTHRVRKLSTRSGVPGAELGAAESANPLLVETEKENPILLKIQDPLQILHQDAGAAAEGAGEAAAAEKGASSFFVGRLYGFCSEEEMLDKQQVCTTSDFERLEAVVPGDPEARIINPLLAVASFRRSDAGKPFHPVGTRPAVWCRRTVHHLLTYSVDADLTNPAGAASDCGFSRGAEKKYLVSRQGRGYAFLDVYNFVRDRLRACWQHLTVQHVQKHRAYIETLEISFRFLIFAEHALASDPSFDRVSNQGLMQTCLDKLMHGYEAVRSFQAKRDFHAYLQRCSELAQANTPSLADVLVYASAYEGEFWGYRILSLMSVSDSERALMGILQRVPAGLLAHRSVRFARAAFEAFRTANVRRYVQLMRTGDFLCGVLMNKFANFARARALRSLVFSRLVQDGRHPVTLHRLRRLLGFDGESDESFLSFLSYFSLTENRTHPREVLVRFSDLKKPLLQDLSSYRKVRATTFASAFLHPPQGISRQKLFDPDYPDDTGDASAPVAPSRGPAMASPSRAFPVSQGGVAGREGSGSPSPPRLSPQSSFPAFPPSPSLPAASAPSPAVSSSQVGGGAASRFSEENLRKMKARLQASSLFSSVAKSAADTPSSLFSAAAPASALPAASSSSRPPSSSSPAAALVSSSPFEKSLGAGAQTSADLASLLHKFQPPFRSPAPGQPAQAPPPPPPAGFAFPSLPSTSVASSSLFAGAAPRGSAESKPAPAPRPAEAATSLGLEQTGTQASEAGAAKLVSLAPSPPVFGCLAAPPALRRERESPSAGGGVEAAEGGRPQMLGKIGVSASPSPSPAQPLLGPSSAAGAQPSFGAAPSPQLGGEARAKELPEAPAAEKHREGDRADAAETAEGGEQEAGAEEEEDARREEVELRSKEPHRAAAVARRERAVERERRENDRREREAEAKQRQQEEEERNRQQQEEERSRQQQEEERSRQQQQEEEELAAMAGEDRELWMNLVGVQGWREGRRRFEVLRSVLSSPAQESKRERRRSSESVASSPRNPGAREEDRPRGARDTAELRAASFASCRSVRRRCSVERDEEGEERRLDQLERVLFFPRVRGISRRRRSDRSASRPRQPAPRTPKSTHRSRSLIKATPAKRTKHRHGLGRSLTPDRAAHALNSLVTSIVHRYRARLLNEAPTGREQDDKNDALQASASPFFACTAVVRQESESETLETAVDGEAASARDTLGVFAKFLLFTSAWLSLDRRPLPRDPVFAQAMDVENNAAGRGPSPCRLIVGDAHQPAGGVERQAGSLRGGGRGGDACSADALVAALLPQALGFLWEREAKAREGGGGIAGTPCCGGVAFSLPAGSTARRAADKAVVLPSAVFWGEAALRGQGDETMQGERSGILASSAAGASSPASSVPVHSCLHIVGSRWVPGAADASWSALRRQKAPAGGDEEREQEGRAFFFREEQVWEGATGVFLSLPFAVAVGDASPSPACSYGRRKGDQRSAAFSSFLLPSATAQRAAVGEESEEMANGEDAKGGEAAASALPVSVFWEDLQVVRGGEAAPGGMRGVIDEAPDARRAREERTKRVWREILVRLVYFVKRLRNSSSASPRHLELSQSSDGKDGNDDGAALGDFEALPPLRLLFTLIVPPHAVRLSDASSQQRTTDARGGFRRGQRSREDAEAEQRPTRVEKTVEEEAQGLVAVALRRRLEAIAADAHGWLDEKTRQDAAALLSSRLVQFTCAGYVPAARTMFSFSTSASPLGAETSSRIPLSSPFTCDGLSEGRLLPASRWLHRAVRSMTRLALETHRLLLLPRPVPLLLSDVLRSQWRLQLQAYLSSPSQAAGEAMPLRVGSLIDGGSGRPAKGARGEEAEQTSDERWREDRRSGESGADSKKDMAVERLREACHLRVSLRLIKQTVEAVEHCVAFSSGLSQWILPPPEWRVACDGFEAMQGEGRAQAEERGEGEGEGRRRRRARRSDCCGLEELEESYTRGNAVKTLRGLQRGLEEKGKRIASFLASGASAAGDGAATRAQMREDEEAFIGWGERAKAAHTVQDVCEALEAQASALFQFSECKPKGQAQAERGPISCLLLVPHPVWGLLQETADEPWKGRLAPWTVVGLDAGLRPLETPEEPARSPETPPSADERPAERSLAQEVAPSDHVCAGRPCGDPSSLVETGPAASSRMTDGAAPTRQSPASALPLDLSEDSRATEEGSASPTADESGTEGRRRRREEEGTRSSLLLVSLIQSAKRCRLGLEAESRETENLIRVILGAKA